MFLDNKKNINMPIVQALIKHGYENFSLIIIEYCKATVLLDRETFWINILNPYYNVLKVAGSSIGYKHSDLIKFKLSELAKSRKHSAETKLLISKATKGKLNPFFNKKHTEATLDKMIISKSSHRWCGKVLIYNSLKELLVVYPSIRTLAKDIKTTDSALYD